MANFPCIKKKAGKTKQKKVQNAFLSSYFSKMLPITPFKVDLWIHPFFNGNMTFFHNLQRRKNRINDYFSSPKLEQFFDSDAGNFEKKLQTFGLFNETCLLGGKTIATHYIL